MPQVVLHILIPLILAALFKDYYDGRHKKKLPLHYVLIAGVAGVVPDLDIAVFWILHSSGFTLSEIHRTFTHIWEHNASRAGCNFQRLYNSFLSIL